MSIVGFIAKNAVRNKRRALLSILSVAASLFLFVILQVGLRELTLPVEDIGSASRVIARNRISLGNLLPARQKPIIERIPGVEAISPFTWFGGKFQGEEVMFAQFAVDPEAFLKISTDAKISPAEAQAFASDRRGCLIGKITADKYKLKPGDRFVLEGTFWPFDLELTVSGIYSGTPDDRNLFFNHKYLDEAAGDLGDVGTWWIKVRSPEEVGAVVTAIDKAFENTSAEVRAETERAFQLGFISMWGNIKVLINVICSVVVFTLILVSASTMSMAIRERFRELAVLKAIGFRRRELFGFILAESFGLAAIGALIGVGGAWALFTFVPAHALTGGFFPTLEVTPRIVGMGCFIAALLGIVASVAPSLSVARMSVVQGLKT
ncbi:MAG TPA: FtsX-like permease family protein, partial [Candidatus Kapabacteria bacterium]|nr:FtsX-like permease family protein [Candidatus Kapabacteria bacterium]